MDSRQSEISMINSHDGTITLSNKLKQCALFILGKWYNWSIIIARHVNEKDIYAGK